MALFFLQVSVVGFAQKNDGGKILVKILLQNSRTLQKGAAILRNSQGDLSPLRDDQGPDPVGNANGHCWIGGQV